MWWWTCVVGIAFALSGCCFGGGTKITPVDPLIVAAVVGHLRKKRKWKFGEPKGESDGVRNAGPEAQRIDRHRGMFVRRRVEITGSQNSDLVAEIVPGWETAPVAPRLVRRIESELDAVEVYFKDKIGKSSAPGPLAGGAGDLVPPHLDLADVARRKSFDTVGGSRSRAAEYTRLRKQRATAIIWRAAQHDEIWDVAADRVTSTMRRPVLDELVDRRLRAIERMAFQVSNVVVLGGRSWREETITDGDGPWRDGFRIRPFEYPRLQRSTEPFAKMSAAIGNANIAPKTADRFVPMPGEPRLRPWRLGVNGRRLEWNAPPRGLRLAPRIAADFRVSDHDNYFFTMRKGGRSASEIVDDMFHVGLADSAREDFWQRSWLMCDHAVAALMLEGLRFALRRRTGNDDAFDRLLSDNGEGAIQLGPFGGSHLPSHFQLLSLRAQDLQVGDHTIFWNSHLYLALTAGDWRLEHSLVMDVDNDPATGNVRLDGVHLQGHGIGELSYRRYQNGILTHVQTALEEAQDLARKEGAGPNGATIDYAGNKPGFIRWSPYEQFASPGAWWVFVPEAAVERFNGLRSNPKVVIDLPPSRRGAGYHEPPRLDGLYFPLFTPRIKHGWNGYLAKRQIDATFKPPKLDSTTVDASIIPGIFQRGIEEQNAPITALQPKARR